jgi:hypothetical protein
MISAKGLKFKKANSYEISKYIIFYPTIPVLSIFHKILAQQSGNHLYQQNYDNFSQTTSCNR